MLTDQNSRPSIKNLSYENAKITQYLKLKSDQQYPKDQISAIDQKLQDIQAENDRLNKQKKITMK